MAWVLITISVLLRMALGASRRNDITIPHLGGRIVGGSNATIETYPYQVSLVYRSSHICGGSIISPLYVITAAHCTEGMTPANLSIRANSSILNSGGIIITVEKIFDHPKFNYSSLDYDISILRLASNLAFGVGISSIALPVQDQVVPEGLLTVVTGWGKTGQGLLATQLQYVEVPIVSLKRCRESYSAEVVTDRMVCAGYAEGGKDACQGDSGGPLVSKGVLLGIVSWGSGCARPNYPGVYTSVPALHYFVNETVAL